MLVTGKSQRKQLINSSKHSNLLVTLFFFQINYLKKYYHTFDVSNNIIHHGDQIKVPVLQKILQSYCNNSVVAFLKIISTLVLLRSLSNPGSAIIRFWTSAQDCDQCNRSHYNRKGDLSSHCKWMTKTTFFRRVS